MLLLLSSTYLPTVSLLKPSCNIRAAFFFSLFHCFNLFLERIVVILLDGQTKLLFQPFFYSPLSHLQPPIFSFFFYLTNKVSLLLSLRNQ